MGIPEKAVIRGEEILQYIPQRSPMVMVDEFFGIEDDLSFSALTINNENIFVENGVFIETGIIEHIAQSCALRVGYVCKQNNIPVPVGFIGAVKKMHFGCLPQAGERLVTTIKIMQEVFDITLISAEVKVNEITIASGEMKIFLDKNK